MVSLDHFQRDHKVDIGLSVSQLVEFNIDGEEVLPHIIYAHLQALAHHIPGRRKISLHKQGLSANIAPPQTPGVMKFNSLKSIHKEQHRLCAAKFTSNSSFLCWTVFLLFMAVVPKNPVPGWLHHHPLGILINSRLINQTFQGWAQKTCVFNKPPSNSVWLHLLSHCAWALCPT